MKNLNLLNLTLLAILASTTACNNIPESDYWAKQNPYSDPVTIFYEDFGTAAVATPWPAVADYTGYKKEGVGAAAVTFAAEGGMVSVRGNSNSSGYDGVSGSCNAMAAAAGATFLINDIATCGAVNLELSFGSNQTNDTLAVSYKINATNDWVPITYTKTTNAWGLASDIKITLPAGTNTIKLKFVALKTQFGTRLDDIKITSRDNLGEPVITPDGGVTPPNPSDGTNLYSENFGSAATASPWPAAADYSGYQKTGIGAASVTYTAEGGAVSIRNNSSSNYADASGVCNAMMAAAGASLIINDIATCGAKNLTLSFGSNQTNSILTVAYKINGTTQWNTITYTKTSEEWERVANLTITLPTGANTIKLKFTAAATQYGTRIDDIQLLTKDATGTAIIDPDNGTTEPPIIGTGDGETSATAYTVSQAIANQTSPTKWVKGYIVGCVKNGKSTVASAEDVFIGVSSGFDSNTNVLIADSPTENDYHKCVAVNLPSGKPLRTQINLLDNAGNYKKQLTVKGVLRSYFGISGLRDSSGETADFIFDAGSNPPDPSGILNETLLTQASFDKFTAVSVSGDLAWNFNANYGAVMSGYDTQSHANEDWFISPVVNLAGKSNVVLTFDHARGPAASMSVSTDNYTLWISTNYTSGAPSTATWTQLAIPTHATVAWAYVASGNIAIPADKLTATTRFAFKYICSDSESATWEVKNIVVK